MCVFSENNSKYIDKEKYLLDNHFTSQGYYEENQSGLLLFSSITFVTLFFEKKQKNPHSTNYADTGNSFYFDTKRLPAISPFNSNSIECF